MGITSDKAGRAKQPRRGKGPVAVAAMLSRITDAALRKRGFAQTAVVTNWAEIVGPELAADTAPQKLTFAGKGRGEGTLHVRVSGPLAIELQHMEPLVLDRINTYFGYRAVARLALVQGPLPPAREDTAAKPLPALDAEEADAVEQTVSGVRNDSLRSALSGLGRAVKAAEKAARARRKG